MLATRRWLGALVLVFSTVMGCRSAEQRMHVSDPQTRRPTKSGEVLGFADEHDTHGWLGIPFAAPPTAELRWRAPLPPPSWVGARESLQFGSPCVQYASAFGGVKAARPGTPVGNEDCLFLNIWAPRFTPDSIPKGTARLPVMFWIHGGGNTIGEAGFYDGANLAGSQKVIVVTTNYRLGPFGWFHNAAINDTTTSDDERSGNFGLLDLIASLRWVRENIAAFGGDPGNVTIFGESAGGTNVYSLLLSPRARGLFHRAIVESGGFFFTPPARAEGFVDDPSPGDANSSNEALLRLIVNDRVARDRDGAKIHLSYVQPADAGRYLRGKKAYDLLGAYEPMPNVGMVRMPTVIADGTVLPKDDPLEVMRRADGYNQVPVILGTNRDENKLFMFGSPEHVHKLLWMFPRLNDPAQYNLTAEYLAKNWKAMGADEPAAALRSAQGPSVFVYRFDWDEEPTLAGSDLAVMLGAAHGFEIPFVFGHFDLGSEGNRIFTKDNESGRLTLSQAMMSYWAEFAYSGTPNQGRERKLPRWTAWDTSSNEASKFMVLDTEAGGGLRMSADAVNRDSVLSTLASDSRFATSKDRCKVYHALADWSRGITRNDFAKACPEFPYDKYPWS